MKRFLTSLATFSLAETFGRHPVLAGVLSLLGVGGGAVIATNLITPTLTPFISSNFNPSQSVGTTNNGLKPNGGTNGATQFPTTMTNSAAWYFEATVNPNLGYSQTVEAPFFGAVLNANNVPGQPNFNFQRLWAGQQGSQWWLNPGAPYATNGSLTAGSNFAAGFYPFSANTSGCTRSPTGVLLGGQVQWVDPGFGCPATATVNVATIPGLGIQQATGLAASLGATTCVSNLPVTGEMKVTVNLAVAHGLTPGMAYTLQGFNGTGFTGYNASYIALPGTTGSTLVGETTTGAGACPTSPLDTSGHEGTALSGTGGSITPPAITATNPFPGATGVTVKNGQHVCGWLVENGDDSDFPGSQSLEMVDDKGNALPGSPALVPYLNQGTASQIGYTVTTAQNTSFNVLTISGTTMTTQFSTTIPAGAILGGSSVINFAGATVPTTQTGTSFTITNPGSVSYSGLTGANAFLPALNVTALNTFTGTSSWAAYNSGTGRVTFSLTTNPSYTQGSEFTVSGMTPSGFNQTYVTTAVSGSSAPFLVTARPLSGPAGTPITNNPGASTGSGGSLASVIMPGQTVLSATPGTTYVLPYGTYGGTGTGGVGTYALENNQTTALGSVGSPVTIFAYSSFYYTATVNGALPAGASVTRQNTGAIGDFIPELGSGSLTVNGSTKTGWGGSLGNFATLWGVLPTQSGGAPSTAALASICTKQTDIQAYAAAQTTAGNPIKVNSLYRLNDLGIWGDSGNATVTGYIDSASGTSGGTATLHVVSTPFGSLALATGTQTAKLTGIGLPVTSSTLAATAATIPLTTSASSSYTVTFPTGVTSINDGSLGSPVTFAVGAFLPALPIQSNTIVGYIDTTSGVSTLHVTSLDDGVGHSGFAHFTGTLNTSFTGSTTLGSTALSVTAPTALQPGVYSAVLGPGMTVYDNAGNLLGTILSQPTSTASTPSGASGLSGTYTLTAGATATYSGAMLGGGTQLAGPPTALTVSSVTGTIQAGMAVTDGGASLTGAPLLITGGSGSVWTVAGNYYPEIRGDTTMTATLSTLVPGEYLQNTAITNPVKIAALGSGANGLSPGNYVLSGPPNASGAVGSSGSPATFLGTTITDGGAIAPGPALTIRDQGPAITFPLDTPFSSKTGTIRLSGAYDIPTLGGTPTGIQVLVSNSANGPPLASCTPCNWGTMTSTITGGAWSGTISGIPEGGPYFVSVRATNGTAYATLPNSVKVGLIFALYGQGQADSIQGAQSGNYTSFFSGLWGQAGWVSPYPGLEHYLQGPPITANFVPGQPYYYAGDRFGVVQSSATVSEAYAAFDQELLNAFGAPTSFFSATRDGVGIGLITLGNAPQSQTVGAGDGSTLTWCSTSSFCPSAGVSPAGPLVFGAASLTGGWFSGTVSVNGLSQPIVTATTRIGGALEPGMVLSTPNAPTLVQCLTGCSSGMNYGGSTWLLSSNADNGATGAMRADAPASLLPFGATTTPWPNLNIQTNGATSVYGFAGFGWPLVKAGTFKVTVNGATVCQDSGTFAYSNTGGNCAGAGVTGFVNYQTGDYQINFTTAPASNAAIIASWTNIVSPQTVNGALNGLSRPTGIDFFGDGTSQSGADSALFSKAPGGVNGHIFSGEGTDKGYMMNQNGPSNVGYQFGGIGYSQMISWLYGTKFPALVPGANPSVPFITTGQWRIEGPSLFSNTNLPLDGVHDQWTQDVATSSTFSGTIASSVLTLSTDAVGPMWEGEIVNCAPVTTNCGVGPLSGVYITSLASGAWGKNGSTYNLAGSPSNVATAAALHNPVYYSGPGPAYYAGTLNDVIVQTTGLAGTTGRAPHTSNGFTGGRRATSRWAAMIYGANGGNATDPKVDRVKADATGCDTSALAAPCFDVGTTYQASHAATWSGNTVTISGGLTAHARPFVVGQAVSCSGCNSGLVITSLSVPPTQSTATGAGEIGQTFTFTVNNASGQTIGGSGTGTVTAGCSGASGTGSNCIDVAISTNVGGTFGTAAAIATCGANNLNGNAPNYIVPNGKCQDNGIGEIVRAFRIGTNQLMFGNGNSGPTAGSVFDDGVDIAGGFFTQNSAFTCNIVAAKVVQCVKAPAYSSGALTGIGLWSSGSTYISYGDLTVVSGRFGSLLGYAGGQSFPITSGGTGYSNQTGVAATCTTMASGGTAPRFDIWTSGGVIVDVVPSAATSGNVPAGLGVGSTCIVTPTGGTGGAIATIPVAPLEGAGGIGTFNTDSNTMGMFLYDNSGFPGNPLNQFFTNGTGGYFEPGLPLRPFGEFQGAAVSG
jgi:hypothetical protein